MHSAAHILLTANLVQSSQAKVSPPPLLGLSLVVCAVFPLISCFFDFWRKEGRRGRDGGTEGRRTEGKRYQGQVIYSTPKSTSLPLTLNVNIIKEWIEDNEIQSCGKWKLLGSFQNSGNYRQFTSKSAVFKRTNELMQSVKDTKAKMIFHLKKSTAQKL